MTAQRPRLLLVNPNTTVATTQAMAAIAAEAAGGHAKILSMTAPLGAPLITTEAALTDAALVVGGMVDAIARMQPDGVIVAAFGDPGLSALRVALNAPVTGIGEAAYAAAAEHGAFCVVTTTPGLAAPIAAAAEAAAGDLFRGVVLTREEPEMLMADPSALASALEEACGRAAAIGVQALIIGGGPLASAARAIAPRLGLPIIEPVPEAVRLALRRLQIG